MVTSQRIHKIIDPDLMSYPSKVQAIDIEQWHTIGDLHGNPLKLLHFMIAIGAALMQEEDYKAYAELYLSYTPPDKDKFNAMEALLNKITVVKDASVRQIGDEFADRGRDDGLMTSLIHKFMNKGGIFESILSNHVQVFLVHIEFAIYVAKHYRQASNDGSPLNDDPASFNSRFITAFNSPITALLSETNPREAAQVNIFYRSVLGLRKSLDARVIKPETLLEQYSGYIKTLKMFSYDYPEELNGEPVTYSHAGISRVNILDLAQMFNKFLPENDRIKRDANVVPTNKCMPPIIDKLNQVMATQADKNALCELLVDSNGNGTYLSDIIDNREDPNDDAIFNNHGHHSEAFGKRITLDTFAGRELPQGGFMRSDHQHTCDIHYTKTYKSPELAQRAYAKRLGTQNLLSFSNTVSTSNPLNLLANQAGKRLHSGANGSNNGNDESNKRRPTSGTQ
ncbi:MAG: hypothetical protein ACHQAX_06065 [Gammaproteobacteria bacterium]